MPCDDWRSTKQGASDVVRKGFSQLVVVGRRSALLVVVSAGLYAEPIVRGYESMRQAAGADVTQAGLLLLGELGCTHCHEAKPVAQSLIDARGAPRLSAVGSRLEGSYLRRFIDDPQGTKPGTTMPRQLRHLVERERDDAVTALSNFLRSSGRSVSAKRVVKGVRERGQFLYHRVGCVACHDTDEAYRPEGWTSDFASLKLVDSSIPLGDLGQKYQPGQLAQFLLDPLRSRPSARMPRTPLTETEAADLEAYLIHGGSGPARPAESARPKSADGRQLFSEMGCAACHEMTAKETRLTSELHAKSLAELNDRPTHGCLAEHPPPGAPDFGFTEEQREALRQAIVALVPGPREQTSWQNPIEFKLRALNCLACHVRDGKGGPKGGRAAYFEAADERDLGDEGRFPPALTGVGRKLTLSAMNRSLRGEDRTRPYLATRMPDYGAERTRALAKLFEQADLSDDIEPVERRGRNRYGRQLIGQSGLGCVGCHDLQGYRSPGIGAIDLAHSPKRLRVEWFRDFLIDPSHLLPGTRMPSFWPGGKAVNQEILGGNTARQIDSLWVYLMEIDQTRLPEGMEDQEAFELKPRERPIVFRTFMTGVGMHAVAVGFPTGIHAAFDSQQIRWARAWRGAFLNAESTWDDRFTPLTPTLSDDLLTLPPGPPLAILGDRDSPWPLATGVPAGYRFGGFRLDSSGVPTFLYEFAGLRIEDRIVPAEGGRSLRREVRLRGSVQRLWFRAGVGERIRLREDGSYQIDGSLVVRLTGTDPYVRRSRSGRDPGSASRHQELVVRVSLTGGETIVKQVLTW